MKIISLNTWGGIAGLSGLIQFFEKHQDVDIFCLQEIFDGGADEPAEIAEGIELKEFDLLQSIKNVLPNHTAYFRPHLKEYYGLAMFVKNGTKVYEESELYVHHEKGYIPTANFGNHARNIQYADVDNKGGRVRVINFHGLWNGRGKTDSDERMAQSNKIAGFIRNTKTEIVFCGDFNLLPTTESLKIIEDTGLQNLIKKFGITSTRSSHYTKPEKYADYAFVSAGVKVKDFKVLPDDVSDHLPLYLEIE